MIEKSFAVSKRKRSRKEAYSPFSAGWTLYKPEKLAELLRLETETVNKALEKTGFNKAVRIREELIKWKERLRKEQRQITLAKRQLQNEKLKLLKREGEVRESLENVRNILRIQREQKKEL